MLSEGDAGMQSLDSRIEEMRMVSGKDIFLNARIDAEDEARDLLNTDFRRALTII